MDGFGKVSASAKGRVWVGCGWRAVCGLRVRVWVGWGGVGGEMSRARHVRGTVNGYVCGYECEDGNRCRATGSRQTAAAGGRPLTHLVGRSKQQHSLATRITCAWVIQVVFIFCFRLAGFAMVGLLAGPPVAVRIGSWQQSPHRAAWTVSEQQ